MPKECDSEWLKSPNGQGYATDNFKATSITWCDMDDNNDPMAQPSVPYDWPNVAGGLFPGREQLYPAGECTKPAPGLYVTELAGTGPECVNR